MITPTFCYYEIISILLRFKVNYLEKNAWVPQFLFVDSNSPYEDLFFRLFPLGPNLVQKPVYLVTNFLKVVGYTWCLMGTMCSANHPEMSNMYCRSLHSVVGVYDSLPPRCEAPATSSRFSFVISMLLC